MTLPIASVGDNRIGMGYSITRAGMDAYNATIDATTKAPA